MSNVAGHESQVLSKRGGSDQKIEIRQFHAASRQCTAKQRKDIHCLLIKFGDLNKSYEPIEFILTSWPIGGEDNTFVNFTVPDDADQHFSAVQSLKELDSRWFTFEKVY